MSSFSCWFHVFLGRPRRLVPGMARFITVRVTLSASRLWTCPNQRRRPQLITSSIGEMCRMRRISSFLMWSRLDTPMIPRSILISVVAIFLLLDTFIAQHSLPYVRAGLIMAPYTFALSRRGIFRSYNTPVNFLQLDQAARTRNFFSYQCSGLREAITIKGRAEITRLDCMSDSAREVFSKQQWRHLVGAFSIVRYGLNRLLIV